MAIQDYVTELAKSAGLSDEQAKALQTAFGNEKVANGFVPRPEFSRALDEKDKTIKDEQAKLGNERQQLTEWYQKSALPAYQQAAKDRDALQKYAATYGELPDGTLVEGGNPTAIHRATEDYISKKDYEAELVKRDQMTVQLIKGASKISTDYLHRFGKPLDLDAVEKIALERNLNLDQAYKELIAPEVEARSATELDAKLKAAREDGLKEGLSRSSTPLDTKPKESHPFFDRYKPEQGASAIDVERKVRNSFVETWNKEASA